MTGVARGREAKSGQSSRRRHTHLAALQHSDRTRCLPDNGVKKADSATPAEKTRLNTQPTEAWHILPFSELTLTFAPFAPVVVPIVLLSAVFGLTHTDCGVLLGRGNSTCWRASQSTVGVLAILQPVVADLVAPELEGTASGRVLSVLLLLL